MISSLQGLQTSAKQFMADNATTILTAGGVVGTVGTAVLAGRAGYKAGQTILHTKGEIYAEQFQREPQDNPVLFENIELSKRDTILAFFPDVIPVVITGGLTCTAIIFANRMSAQKAAALAAAYGLSEKQFREYRDKVQEKLTGPKAQSIDDELAQDRVNGNPNSQQIIIVEGEVLCYDEMTDRYFRSTAERIRRAVNKTNEAVIQEDGVTASFFYDLLGLDETVWSNEVGFNLDNQCDVKISTTKTADDQPCLSIAFRHLPVYEFHRRY